MARVTVGRSSAQRVDWLEWVNGGEENRPEARPLYSVREMSEFGHYLEDRMNFLYQHNMRVRDYSKVVAVELNFQKLLWECDFEAARSWQEADDCMGDRVRKRLFQAYNAAKGDTAPYGREGTYKVKNTAYWSPHWMHSVFLWSPLMTIDESKRRMHLVMQEDQLFSDPTVILIEVNMYFVNLNNDNAAMVGLRRDTGRVSMQDDMTSTRMTSVTMSAQSNG